MRKLLILIISLYSSLAIAQTDYSDKWEDFFSYNNVKHFTIANNTIYAVVDNAIFILDLDTNETSKVSSINGLSGEAASTIFFSETTNKIVIGYENGLIEIINPNNSITVSNDIQRLNVAGSKRVNHFTEYNNKIYISTDFAVIEYNIIDNEFGDTFFIGNGSTILKINEIAVFNDVIYAATQNGIYTANTTNANLIDFNNWQQPSNSFLGDFSGITIFNNKVYAIKNNILYLVQLPNNAINQISLPSTIISIASLQNQLTLTTTNTSYVYNENLGLLNQSTTTMDLDFTINHANSIGENIFIATKEYGILNKSFTNIEYIELHPDGPQSNDVFSIEVNNNNLWIVYGGYAYSTYNFLNNRRGFSHFNGEDWINTRFADNVEYLDLSDISIDPNHENRVFLSSYNQGLIEVVDDEIIQKYTYTNSGIENWSFNTGKTLVSSSVFDSNGDLWLTNPYTNNRLKQFSSSGTWTGYDVESIITSSKRGLGDIAVDRLNNKWIPSRNNGVLVVSANGQQKRALIAIENEGNLPDNMVKAVASDSNNRIWIGTLQGLVTFSGVGNMFESENINARPVLIRLEGGTGDEQAEPLLGEQPINTIAIDGANNKWFGTNNSGVLSTNPSGQETLHLFNTTNSPLPSNEILKIKIDNTTGKVYFATTKGIVAFNDNVAPFGNELGETYAYPNPSTKDNEFITIDGRNGTHLPKNTNVKILDSAGYLVHETNVVEGQEIKGGKVIWNKKNLAGRKVASGIYIILLTIPDASETSITKVAIIN